MMISELAVGEKFHINGVRFQKLSKGLVLHLESMDTEDAIESIEVQPISEYQEFKESASKYGILSTIEYALKMRGLE